MSQITVFELKLMHALEALHSPFGDILARAVSALGEFGAVFILLAALLLAFPRTRRAGCVLALALLLDLLTVNLCLKPLFMRPRPYTLDSALRLISRLPGDASFPSGHTAVAFASAMALRAAGRRAHVAALIFAVLMGLSRVYLMVHFPTDVLAGAAIGSICGYSALFIWKKLAKCDIIIK